MLVVLTVFLSVLCSGAEAFGNCNGNRKGDAWCATRIAAIQANSAFVASNPSLGFTGNLCSSAANDGGLFRWEMCCAACQNMLGGSAQAQKDNSYMNTVAAEACADMTVAATLCARISAMSSTDKSNVCNSATGRIYCKNTCGWCNSATVALLYSTASPCVALSTCYNSSMCRPNNVTSTTQLCSPTGIAGATADTGTCNCDSCINKFGMNCTSDSACGGISRSCEYNSKCNCPPCTVGTGCRSDNDCGGYAGTCGYLSSVARLWHHCGGGRGPAGETCTCRWCPNKACYNNDQACTPANAATTCGDANFCIQATPIYATTNAATLNYGLPCSAAALTADATATCFCRCRPIGTLTTHNSGQACSATTGNEAAVCGVATTCFLLTGTTGTDACTANNPCQCRPTTITGGAQGATITQTGLGYPVCIQGAGCGGALTDMLCGFKGACVTAAGVACPTASTVSAEGTAAVCTCDCTRAPIPAMLTTFPSLCHAQIQTLQSVPLMCDPTVATSCASVAVDTTVPNMGVLSKRVCMPSPINGGMCNCGSALYPKVSSYTGKLCSAHADCQSLDRVTDTSAVCLVAGVCGVANAVVLTPASLINAASCTVDADCGWGTCFTSTTAAKCNGATGCICVPAGCIISNTCSLNFSAATCGLAGNCRGRCQCS